MERLKILVNTIDYPSPHKLSKSHVMIATKIITLTILITSVLLIRENQREITHTHEDSVKTETKIGVTQSQTKKYQGMPVATRS